VPDFLKNRRLDLESGETKHYLSTDLDIKKEFDIKDKNDKKLQRIRIHLNFLSGARE